MCVVEWRCVLCCGDGSAAASAAADAVDSAGSADAGCMPTMPPDSQAPQGPPPDAPQQRQQDQERRNNQQGSAGFLGAWCAQGDPSKQASISSNGPMLNLTNESGSTSIGNMQGNNQISRAGVAVCDGDAEWRWPAD